MKNIKYINEYFDYSDSNYIPNYKKGYIKIMFSEKPNIDDDFITPVDFDTLYHNYDKHTSLHRDPAIEKFEKRFNIKFVGENEVYPDYYNFKTEEGKELEVIKKLEKLKCIEDADFIEITTENIEKGKDWIISEIENLDEPYKVNKDKWNKKIDELIEALKEMKLK